MKRKHFLQSVFPLLSFLLIIVSYKGLFQTFYQQDEWLTFGQIQAGGLEAYWSQFNAQQLISGSGRPLSMIFQYIFFKYFPLQIWPFAIFSIVVHYINSILVYILVEKLFKKRFLAIITALFFACTSASMQALTWFGANTSTLPSASFFFLSLIYIVKTVETRKTKYLIFSQICAIASYFFKESGAIAFVLIPVIYYWWGGIKFTFASLIRKMFVMFLYATVAICIRVLWVINFPAVSDTAFISGSIYIWPKILLHILLYPIISISQMYIPQRMMFTLSQLFQQLNYSTLERFTASQLGVESIVSDFVSFYLSIIIIVVIMVVAYRVKELRKAIQFCFLYIFLSFIPFVILTKGSSYLDSRYFYMGTVGGGLLLAVFLAAILEDIKKREKSMISIYYIALPLLLSLFAYKQMQFIVRDINNNIIVSQERITFIDNLKAIVPSLPQKPVFYVTGNNLGYYGIFDLKVPFQQGPGFTIMCLYYNSPQIPKTLLEKSYLWGIREQGYVEEDNKGYGYFYKLEGLQNSISKYSIKTEQIIGLYYNSETRRITNITPEILQQLYR